MATIGSLAVNLIARTEKFSGGIKKARGDLKLLGSALTSAKGLVLSFGGALAAGFTARGLHQTAEDIDRISKAADRLKISTESLVGLEHAADLSGVSIGKLSAGLNKINLMMADARGGNQTALDAFGRLGIDIQSLNGMGADQVLGKIADRVNSFSDAADKAGAAGAIFGKKLGPGLQDLLKEGSSGLAAMQADAEKLGLTFNSIDGKNVEEANDALTRTMASVKGLARELTIALAPAVTKVANFLTETIGNFNKFGPGAETSASKFGTEMAESKINRMSVDQFNKFVKGDLSAVDQTAAAKRAATMQAQAKADKKASTRAVVDAPGRLLGAGLRKFSSLAGDGADALGKLADKGRSFEKSAMLAATKAQFGMGPFDASRMTGTAVGPNALIDPARVAAMMGGGRAVETRGNAALERGTAAAFSQERRSSQQNQLVDLAKKQLDETKKVVEKLENLKGTNLGAQLLPANIV